MAVMPGVIFKEVRYQRTPMAAYNRVNAHIAVSEADSLFGFFNQPSQVCSHFYVRYDGTIEQYVDTRFRAAADLQGNDATISIESQGGASGSWTEAQKLAIAAIFRWARETHGIENKIATSSRPGPESRGLSYHRFGIDPWRVSGGMYYSKARGKTCPTDARIAQIDDIYALSNGQLPDLGGGGAGVPTPIPVPPRPQPVKTWVQRGDTGPLVVELQTLLGITADGVFGAQTEATVRWYQADRGLTVDGIAGEATFAALRSGKPPVAPPPAPGAPAFPLPVGYYFGPKSGPVQSVSGYYSNRADLQRWQQRMADRGWNIGVDGLYGPNTEAVARAFQSEKGLTVDGLIGPVTWAKAWTAPIT